MDQRFVVVTGASKGIGRAAALYLDRQGFSVFAGIRNPADGEALKKDASSNLRPIQIDVTRAEDIKRAAEEVKKVVGEAGLAGLVNNAGVAIGAPLEFVPIDELRRQLEINVIGHVAVTQAFLPLVRKAKGRIINISSIGGRIAGPFLGSYHASKWALEAITDSLRLELKRWGIEVVSIEPGRVRTPIWETSTNLADHLFADAPPEFRELYPNVQAASKRLAENSTKGGIAPEEVAAVIFEALTTRRPHTRYLVGRDAKILGGVVAKLPDRIKDRLVTRRVTTRR